MFGMGLPGLISLCMLVAVIAFLVGQLPGRGPRRRIP